jgi:ABC-2 type transport system ATP-binding protein
MIECKQLTKKHGNFTALNEVSFKLESDKIYGLLGRNGAGKTTLLHLLNAQMFPNSGTILIDGHAPFENASVLQKVCFIKESNNFKKNMKISEVLDLASLFYPHWDANFALELLEQLELDQNKKVKVLSKGMESALGILVGLASRAPITIYDEPYIGLDAISRQMFYDILLEDYVKHPRTIILSTHLIDEVSRLFEKVIIVNQGKIMLLEDTETLRHKAYYLTGDVEVISEFTKNKHVVLSESLGKTLVVATYGDLSPKDKQEAEQSGIDIAPVPIEKLMIYLTSKRQREEIKSA